MLKLVSLSLSYPQGVAFLLVTVLLILLEIALRLLFGFGDPLLYLADPHIGYLLAPNQKVRRFGNRIEINEFSMRSDSISTKRPDATLRILMIGDSIVNGGWWTDQPNTLSEMLATWLRSSKSVPLEVLNASANSWAPRNELAYLKQFGLFDAQAVVLVINTDDLFATAPTPLPVGHDRNYPDRKPPLALIEAFNRFLPPPPVSEELKAVYAEGGDRVGANLEAIRQIHLLVKQSGAQFLLVMTPLLREIGQPGSRDYEVKARQRLIEFTQSEAITYLDFLPLFNAANQPETLYQDHIHLNLAGNTLVSEKIGERLWTLNLGL
ncbi:SGNH/GDSL hydrolase family protein [Phormidesmis sp. 146-12]